MLKKSSLIAKINGWNSSFQNMYDMLQVKVDRFARNTFFLQKNAEKQPFFEDSKVSWLWEEMYAKLLGLGQL